MSDPPGDGSTRGSDRRDIDLRRRADRPAKEEIYAAALAGLAGMTPKRLARMLDGFQPMVAWSALGAGTHPGDPERQFASAARRTDVDEVADRCARAGMYVLLPGRHGYPSGLVGDPGAPAVLFAIGDPMVLEGGPRMAIVGTRSATPYGRRVASELAGNLSSEGVAIVSGLASGIDAAAHVGALRSGRPQVAPPIGVVGTGLDVVYPSSSRELWGQVAVNGVVFSESALGTPPHPGVFPARNRIIAALSDVVVVVESHARGGALYTAEAAARRGIPVCAVPGSVHSRASAGSNALLVDGCAPVRDAADVMVALGLVRAGTNLSGLRGGREESRTGPTSRGRAGIAPGHRRDGSGRRQPGSRRAVGLGQPSTLEDDDEKAARREPRLDVEVGRLTPSQRTLLTAVDDTPTAFETILLRTDLAIAAAAEACDELVDQGILRAGAGWWFTA